jgi:phage terminase large subunit-like protein
MSYLRKIEGLDISSLNHEVKEYHQGWQAMDQYAYDVQTGVVTTSDHVKQSVARYIHDRLTRDDIELRTIEVDNLISFCNKIRHNKGPLAGKPIMLMTWMIFALGNIFGWYCISGERMGERRFVKSLILLARGNAKSFLCSLSSLYSMATALNGMPLNFSAARNAKQAAIVFNDAKLMLRGADYEISSLFEVSMYEIKCLVNDGSFRALASDAQSADGLRLSFAVMDELHAHTSADMLNTMITGSTASVDPLIFMISTAGSQLEGVCIQERNLTRDINAGIEIVDDYFAVEYSISEDDDWQDETNWIKANPALGHAVNINALRGELARARQSAANRKDFLTKYCCRFVNMQDSPYIDVLEFQTNCARDDLQLADYVGRECYIGLDLAQRFDLAALAMLFPEDDGTMTCFMRQYCSRGAMKKLTASKYEMYNQWEDDGTLIVTGGHSTDFEYIKDDIRWAAKTFDLIDVGYDPYAASQMALELEAERIPMTEVRQGIAQLSEPSKLLQVLIAESKFNYQSHDKVLEWNASNTVCSFDKTDNMKVHKPLDNQHAKVDSIIAIITGLNPESLKKPKPKNPYLKRGMIIL